MLKDKIKIKKNKEKNIILVNNVMWGGKKSHLLVFFVNKPNITW